jgi:hypothetical protein
MADDLDRLEALAASAVRRLRSDPEDEWHVGMDPQTVLALVAALRAADRLAREAVTVTGHPDLATALVDYERARRPRDRKPADGAEPDRAAEFERSRRASLESGRPGHPASEEEAQ